MRDFTSVSELQGYIHHFLAIIGSIGGIYVGGVIGGISNFILITEITTPMVNARWLMYFHEKTHYMAYILCAVGMTVGFLVIRVLLMVYLAFFYFLPHISSKD